MMKLVSGQTLFLFVFAVSASLYLLSGCSNKAPVQTTEIVVKTPPPPPQNIQSPLLFSHNDYDWHAPATCKTDATQNYSACYRGPAGTVARFNIQNRGPNRIVPARGDVEGRTWTFIINEKSRQASAIRVSDVPDGSNSHAREVALILFPRNYSQSIAVSGGTQTVTLSNGEKIVFDKDSGVILGGVFEEGRSVGKRKPDINYTGEGVLLRADHIAQDPRLSNTVYVYKKGQPVCRLKNKSVFVHEAQKINFKFEEDESFNKFLVDRCGFGFLPNI